MTDQIPADKVREILDEWERIKEYADWEDMDNLVQDVRALLPAPQRPTLADMTPSKRAACQWMQCDVRGFQGQLVLATPHDDDGHAGLISACGEMAWSSPGHVTPRPDLPRMEWPAVQDAEEADPVKVGDVIESADDARLAALPDGSILLDRDNDSVTKQSEGWEGLGYQPTPNEGDNLGPWKVVHIEQDES